MMKVGILNNYLSTFGGGEKDTYVIANRLAQLGFQVEVFTFEEKVPTAAEIEAFFGPGHSGFAIRRLAGADEKARDKQLRAALKGYSVFINHCAGSSFVNPCPVGIYWLMFPMQAPGLFLRSYHQFICISEFTRFYCRHLWGADLATTVLHPCCEDQPGPAGPRAREILTVGRFNWNGHKKNQDLLVDAFEELLASLPGWRLTLIGKLNDGAETDEHLGKLRERCRGLPISFEVNATELRKRELLSRAAIYWHGTGIGASEPEDAARMEHFGIAVVEAMRAGAVPLCYQSGGPAEIVEHGKSGFVYRDLDELKTFTRLLALQAQISERFKASAIERAGRYSRSAFHGHLDRFIERTVAA